MAIELAFEGRHIKKGGQCARPYATIHSFIQTQIQRTREF